MSVVNLLKFITSHPINRKQKLNAIGRFIRWQISSRLAPGPILYDWINGSKFLVQTGETGFTGNIYAGLHEFSDMAFVLHALRSDDTFVDVGANVGSYTILAGSVVGAKGYSFEPVPKTFFRLTENIRINHIEDRVKAFNLGLAQQEGTLRFTSDLDTINHAISIKDVSSNSIEVKVTTLDKELSFVHPNLIKIDVEGYEKNVLDGAQITLGDSRLNSIIIELNGSGDRYGFDDESIVDMLLKFEFKPFSYDPMSRSLNTLDGKNQRQGNTIFIRDTQFIQKRVENAPKFDIFGIGV